MLNMYQLDGAWPRAPHFLSKDNLETTGDESASFWFFIFLATCVSSGSELGEFFLNEA